VACFAFEQDVAFVDTNVRRVVGRLVFGHGWEDVKSREIAQAAAALVPGGRGWAWNQGLLDFGALHCTARKPKCASCPLAEVCAAYPVTADADAKRARGTGTAPRFAESNRFYRGRVLAALREEHADETSDGIPLSVLGRQVKPEFEVSDLPWLYGVVSGLQKDGLAAIGEERPAYDAGSTASGDVVIRLP
jgi:A/G-specific adenine glycosylase